MPTREDTSSLDSEREQQIEDEITRLEAQRVEVQTKEYADTRVDRLSMKVRQVPYVKPAKGHRALHDHLVMLRDGWEKEPEKMMNAEVARIDAQITVAETDLEDVRSDRN